MDIKKNMRQYYESEVEKIEYKAPPPDILNEDSRLNNNQIKFSLENVFGCLVTAGCLLSVIAPGSWFSFGRFLLSFRPGFLF